MKETFRVSPTVPGVMRVLPEDTVLCDYHVPAGTAVFANSLIACRNEVSCRIVADRYSDNNLIPEMTGGSH